MQHTSFAGRAPSIGRSGSMAKGCLIGVIVVLVLLLALGGCAVGKYNTIIENEQKVEETLTKIDNQYKRRYDLVPQLVEIVKGAADFEKSTITEVTEARASVGRLQLPENVARDPAALEEYMAAQAAFGGSLSRLLVAVESYPQLRATQNFLSFQDQYEGTENRIAQSRTDYIEAVKGYNVSIKKFPNNFIANAFGFEKLPQLPFEEENLTEAPKIDFSDDE